MWRINKINKMNKIYTIGDIHGEYDKLRNLIDKINRTKGDIIVF